MPVFWVAVSVWFPHTHSQPHTHESPWLAITRVFLFHVLVLPQPHPPGSLYQIPCCTLNLAAVHPETAHSDPPLLPPQGSQSYLS